MPVTQALLTSTAHRKGWFTILKMLAWATESNHLALLIEPIGDAPSTQRLHLGLRLETDSRDRTSYAPVAEGEDEAFDRLLAEGIDRLSAPESQVHSDDDAIRFCSTPLNFYGEDYQAILCFSGHWTEPFSASVQATCDEVMEAFRTCGSKKRFPLVEQKTDQIQESESIRNDWNLLQQAMELGRMAYWVFSPVQKRIVAHSQTLFQMPGFSEAQGSEWGGRFDDFMKRIVHPSDWSLFSKRDNNSEPKKHFTFRALLPTGRIVFYVLHSVTLLDDKGSPESVITVIQDISEQKNVEFSLLEQEKKDRDKEFQYRMLYDHSSDAIHILDNGVITDCNQRTLEIFGFNHRREFLGLSPEALSTEYQPDGLTARESIQKHLERAKAGNTEPYDWISCRKDGSTFESTIRLLPLPGKTDLFQVVVHDVTEQKAAARALEYYRAYISLLAEIRKSSYSRSEQEIIQTYLDTATQYFNFEKAWYGVRIGNSIRPVFHAGKEKNEIDVARVDLEPADEKSFPLVRAVSERRPVAINRLDQKESFEPWRDFQERVNVHSCLAVPVEVHGKIEAGIVFYSSSPNTFDELIVDYLFGSIKELTRIISEKRLWSQQQRTLKKSKETAEAAAQAKAQFLANMSHEIRTPMTSILGYAEILLGDHLARATPPQSDTLSREDCLEILSDCRSSAGVIQNSAEFLLSILNDILDFSKIEANKLGLESRDLPMRPFLQELAAMYSVQAKAKGLNFSIRTLGPVPKSMSTDPLRLKQVLVNLIGNALKFATSGEVDVTVSWVGEDSPLKEIRLGGIREFSHAKGKLRFSIRDTGIGIPPDQISSLFAPFHQADTTTTRRFGGTGLGLAISWRLMKLLGGTLDVTSREGYGSVFTVMLPQKLEPEMSFEEIQDVSKDGLESTASLQTVSAGKPGDQPLAELRLLVVEDGPDNQRLFSFILKKAGAEVVLADNGEIALKIVQESLKGGQAFSMILMDMQMPVMDGYTATRRIRKTDFVGPIIALTAHTQSEERQKCIKAGCDDFATKPILRDALIKTVLKNANRDPET